LRPLHARLHLLRLQLNAGSSRRPSPWPAGFSSRPGFSLSLGLRSSWPPGLRGGEPSWGGPKWRRPIQALQARRGIAGRRSEPRPPRRAPTGSSGSTAGARARTQAPEALSTPRPDRWQAAWPASLPPAWAVHSGSWRSPTPRGSQDRWSLAGDRRPGRADRSLIPWNPTPGPSARLTVGSGPSSGGPVGAIGCSDARSRDSCGLAAQAAGEGDYAAGLAAIRRVGAGFRCGITDGGNELRHLPARSMSRLSCRRVVNCS